MVVKKYIVVDNLKQNGKMEKPYPAFDENNIWIPIEFLKPNANLKGMQSQNTRDKNEVEINNQQ